MAISLNPRDRSGIGSGGRIAAPVSPSSIGSRVIPLAAPISRLVSSSPAERHAALFSKPVIVPSNKPSYIPPKEYLRSIIPNISKNPSGFGGDPRKTGIVSTMLKFEERKAITTGRNLRGNSVSTPAERVGGIQFITGRKKLPNRPDGFLASKIHREDFGIRKDLRGINRIPPVIRADVASAPVSLPVMVPLEETSISVAPPTIKPEETPNVAAVYSTIEGGASNAGEVKTDWSKTILTLGMIALVIFLVTKGRI